MSELYLSIRPPIITIPHTSISCSVLPSINILYHESLISFTMSISIQEQLTNLSHPVQVLLQIKLMYHNVI